MSGTRKPAPGSVRHTFDHVSVSDRQETGPNEARTSRSSNDALAAGDILDDSCPPPLSSRRRSRRHQETAKARDCQGNSRMPTETQTVCSTEPVANRVGPFNRRAFWYIFRRLGVSGNTTNRADRGCFQDS